ncbi:MAG: hypothetical protein ACI9YE_001964 [Psychroserpens sp.]|jgi:hypothetical protein
MNRYRWFLSLVLFLFPAIWLFFYFEKGFSIIPWSSDIIFIDLHTITDSVDSIRAGLNPYNDTSFDILSRTYNYPKIWLNIFDFLGLNGEKTNIVGPILIFIFFVCNVTMFRPSNPNELFLGLLVLLSPPVLLLIERCNSDIIIFSLICLGVLILATDWFCKNYLFAFLILLGSILKLYPIFVLPSIFFLRMSKAIRLVTFISVLLLFVSYIYLNIENYLFVVSNTPLASSLSYGRNVFLQSFFSGIKLQMLTLGFCLLIIAGAFTRVFYLKRGVNSVLDKMYANTTFTNRTFWLVGSLIYVGTFILGNSWNYRLVFLIFTLPILSRNYQLFYVRAYILCLLCLLYLDFIANTKISQEIGTYLIFHGLHQLISWIVFYFLSVGIAYMGKHILKEFWPSLVIYLLPKYKTKLL